MVFLGTTIVNIAFPTISRDLGSAAGRSAWILNAYRSVAFSPDGTLLATTSEDRTARLWDIATGETAYALCAK